MSTPKANGLVRVVFLCLGVLLVINGTGCAWRAGALAPMTGPATAPMTGPAAAPITGSAAAPSPAPITKPEPVRQSGGAPVSASSGSTSAPLSSPPVPRNSTSAPSSAPTSTQSTEPPFSAEPAGAPPSASALSAPPPIPKVNHKRHAGNYRCDHGRTIRVADVPGQTDVILLTWQGAQHRLERVHSNSGAERFEALATGLVWILIPGKAMLLSTNQGRALANECHL